MSSDGDPAPRISFAIPYYQGLEYLSEAIDSVRAQTVDDWELVIVDDQGPEPADALIDRISDPRVRYVRNASNLGLAGNWNECVRQTRAPLVTILHGDDRLRPSYAAAVLGASAAWPDVTAFFTDADIIGPTGQPTSSLADEVKKRLPRRADDHVLTGDHDLAGLLRGNYIVCPTLCFRRDKIDREPFDASLRFVPDWDFTARVLLEGGSLYSIRRPLLEYRRHSSSQTSQLTVDASRFVEELSFLRTMRAECIRRELPRSSRVARRRLTVRVHLLVLAMADAGRGRFSAARAKIKLLVGDLAARSGG